MYESEIEELQEEIATFESSLSDILLAEYYKRRRCVEALLEDFLKNSDDVDELQEDRFNNYSKLDKISNKFIFSSVALFIFSAALDAYSYLFILFYIFMVAFWGKRYFDIRSNDQMQLGNLVLCQIENQRISRDLQKYGISEVEIIRYKTYKDPSRKRVDKEAINDRQMYWIDLRITKQIIEGLSR
jgi:hypothetical protein